MLRKITYGLLAGLLLVFSTWATAASAPSEIKIGTLYSGSGHNAPLGLPDYMGLKIWVAQENAKGGVFVKPFDKRIPIKLIAYDDQSNTSTAATLYNQLITQNKVNILLADGGSVLTAPAVTIAREHKMLLLDQTGSGSKFFTPDNPYIVLTSVAESTVWPKYVAEFLVKDGPKLGIKRVALIYATNEFTGTQATTFRKAIKGSSKLKLVYDHGVPTSTSSYTVLLNSIRATHPDAVIQLGYPPNDVAFLRDLHASGTHFKFLFTIYVGLETNDLLKTVGEKAMQYVYTYMSPSIVEHKVNSGMNLPEYKAAWHKAYPNTHVPFGFNSLSGYTTGIAIQNALAVTKSLKQLDLRKAFADISGKLKTIEGPFILDKDGAQIGEAMPLGQAVPNGKGGLKFVTIYPPDVATGKPVYPAPAAK